MLPSQQGSGHACIASRMERGHAGYGRCACARAQAGRHQVGDLAAVRAQPEQAGLRDDVPHDRVGVLRAGRQQRAAAVVAQRGHRAAVPRQRHLRPRGGWLGGAPRCRHRALADPRRPGGIARTGAATARAQRAKVSCRWRPRTDGEASERRLCERVLCKYDSPGAAGQLHTCSGTLQTTHSARAPRLCHIVCHAARSSSKLGMILLTSTYLALAAVQVPQPPGAAASCVTSAAAAPPSPAGATRVRTCAAPEGQLSERQDGTWGGLLS